MDESRQFEGMLAGLCSAQGAAPPPAKPDDDFDGVWVELTDMGGSWRANAEGTVGMGHEGMGLGPAQAIAMAVRGLAEAEGLLPGLCLGCWGPLGQREALMGAVAHDVCVRVVTP